MLNGSDARSEAQGTKHKPKVCLDATIFTALLEREAERWKLCRDLLHDAQNGKVSIVVSALVLIECEGADNGAVANGAEADLVADFFESEFLTRCNVDPFVGAAARRLRSRLGALVPLPHNAWLHLATAQLEGCDFLMTYDKRLLKLAGREKAEALGALKVTLPHRPWDAGQMSLEDLEGVMPEERADGVLPQTPLERLVEAPATAGPSRRSVVI